MVYTNHKGSLSEKAKAKRVAKIKHLSAKGSANCPNSLTQSNFLAKYPSGHLKYLPPQKESMLENSFRCK